MSDSPETPRPRPPLTPGAPLPRIKYVDPNAPPEDEKAKAEAEAKAKLKARANKSEASPADPVRPKAKKKKSQDGEGDKPRNLIEETPELDTYEARKKARLIVGALLAVVCLSLGFTLWSWLAPAGEESGENLPDEGKLMATATGPAGPGPAAGNHELEARQMFSQAHLMAQNGNTDGAMALLKKLISTYPQTTAATEAQQALDRPRQNLPLFVAGPAVAAKKAEPAPEPVEPPTAIVSATEARPTAPVTGNAQAEASIVLPASPPEPRAPGAGAVAPPGAATTVAARPLPAGFHARPEAGVHPSGWPLEIVGDRDGATMVLVPGGSFTMGRDDGPPAEAPAHQVMLSTYYIDQHEVTVRQFARFLQETGRKSEATRAGGSKDSGTPDPAENRPVVRVTATEAQDFARWANKALPTEAQWEMAARTPDGRLHPWGNSPPPWPRTRAYKQIDPVMSFPGDLSPYGAYDLAGNAFEWTADWYDGTYFHQFRNAPANNPTGPARSKTRAPQMVLKGGSKTWESSWREGMPVGTRLAFLGFRCALTVDAAPPAPLANEAAGNGNPAAPPVAAPANERPPAQNGVVPF